jgi:hypothetical protein
MPRLLPMWCALLAVLMIFSSDAKSRPNFSRGSSLPKARLKEFPRVLLPRAAAERICSAGGAMLLRLRGGEPEAGEPPIDDAGGEAEVLFDIALKVCGVVCSLHAIAAMLVNPFDRANLMPCDAQPAGVEEE